MGPLSLKWKRPLSSGLEASAAGVTLPASPASGLRRCSSAASSMVVQAGACAVSSLLSDSGERACAVSVPLTSPLTHRHVMHAHSCAGGDPACSESCSSWLWLSGSQRIGSSIMRR